MSRPAKFRVLSNYVLQTGAGTGKYFCFDSRTGGSIKTTTSAITAGATSCPSF